MTTEADIAKIIEQEKALCFPSFSEADAWALGNRLRDLAIARGHGLVIDVRLGQRQLFYTALPGTTLDNPEWVRRKINTVYRFEAASYRIGLQMKLKGQQLDHTRGVDPLQYVAAGGGFPIRLTASLGGQMIGAVTVSGIPQRNDHGIVVEALAGHLGVAHAPLALQPETN